jgi:amino acid transporter
LLQVSFSVCTLVQYQDFPVQFDYFYDIDSMQLMGMSDRAKLPSVFSHRSPFGTPTYSIMLCLIVVASVLPLDFALIVEMTNFAYCVSVTLEFASFIKLQVIDGGEC